MQSFLQEYLKVIETIRTSALKCGEGSGHHNESAIYREYLQMSGFLLAHGGKICVKVTI